MIALMGIFVGVPGGAFVGGVGGLLGKSLQESKPGFADAANIMKFNDALYEAATTTKNLDQFAKTIAKSLEMRDSLIKNSNLDVMDAELIAKRSNEILKAAGIKGVMN